MRAPLHCHFAEDHRSAPHLTSLTDSRFWKKSIMSIKYGYKLYKLLNVQKFLFVF